MQSANVCPVKVTPAYAWKTVMFYPCSKFSLSILSNALSEVTERNSTELGQMFPSDCEPYKIYFNNSRTPPIKDGSEDCLFLVGFMTTSRLKHEYFRNRRATDNRKIFF